MKLDNIDKEFEKLSFLVKSLEKLLKSHMIKYDIYRRVQIRRKISKYEKLEAIRRKGYVM